MNITITPATISALKQFALTTLAVVTGLSAINRKWGLVTLGFAVAVFIIVGKI